MTRKGKVAIYIVVAVVGVALLPLLAILPWAASNAFAAGYYIVFTETPSAQELLGSYTAKPTWGTAKLVLKDDRTFDESVLETGKPPQTINGHWSKQSADDGHALAITFSPYINIQEGEPRNTYDSYTVNFYKKKFGTTFGVLNDDTGLRFTKSEN